MGARRPRECPTLEVTVIGAGLSGLGGAGHGGKWAAADVARVQRGQVRSLARGGVRRLGEYMLTSADPVDLGAQSDLIGAPEPMSIKAVLSAPNGGYSRRRAKTVVAVRGGFSSASVLGWRSSCLRPDGMARVLPYP